FPEFTNSLRYKWTNITIIAAFVFLFCNLVFYKPFIFTGNRAYPEIAAIALTNAVLLAALSVLLFATYVTIFKSQRISVSATIISICCSSYLFWTITAKDHMLMAFLFGLLIYFGIKYIYTDEFWHVPAFFVVIGLIAWARAEIAVPLFLAFLILVIAQCVRVIRTKNNNKAEISLLLSPVFTIVGAIPFFVNNYYVTNNPLLPPYAVFNQNNAPSAGNLIASSVSTINTIGASVSPITTSHILVAGTVSPPIPQHALSQFFDTIIANYSIPPGTSIFNLLHLFFLPENRAAIIFIVCSIFLIGLALALLSKISWHDFSRPEKKVVFFLIINTIIIFFAYIHSWIWMSSDSAMIPDIRYFSPVYIPFSIMGIILIQKCGFLPVFSKKGLTVLMFSMGEIVVILVTLLILFKPRDISSQFYFATISETITCIAFALMMLCILAFVFNRDKQNRTEYCSLMLYAIVAAPSVWQLAVIFISSISVHPYGYTYWIPVVKTVMQHLQNFIV
ncbi:MAG: hypothetical protein NTZ39_05215, partial [Methanoregula sp.]|nr:hypothetical protein [Methanoregula sp.]